MTKGWRYRALGVAGTAALTWLAVVLANHPTTQGLLASLPVVGGLPLDPADGPELLFEVSTTLVVVLFACLPLYRPRPRRLLDVVSLTQQRVVLASVVLAAIGYFDYTYRLPRATLLLASAVLFVVLPAWFLLIRHRPDGTAERALLVGDDPHEMAAMVDATDLPVVGYVAPPRAIPRRATEEVTRELPDGGERATRASPAGERDADAAALAGLDHLGGLSRLDEVLVEQDIDTVLLGFSQPDRGDFFGALDECHEHGVTAKVHRRHADAVLTTGFGEGDLVDVDLEPWDLQDHIVKRGFDVAFAAVGLLALLPAVAAIVAAIKLDDGGPVLYSQERTAARGDTFPVYKFRSMVPDAESDTGPTVSSEDDGGADPRVTRIGALLRQTHLDEIPQLWSVLVGDMSVVGPRPERPELDTEMEAGNVEWRNRWFVKPGLTGLAQIHGATGYEPEQKLRYDVEYIRRQSFWFDLKIVVRQVWQVLVDVAATAR